MATDPSATAPPSDPILQVRDLKKYFPIAGGTLLSRTIGYVRAVDGVSFHVNRGETLGLVGESGCGKSTTARLIMRLLEPTSGSIRIDGEETNNLNAGALKALRRKVQIVFQDPYASLNPRMRVGDILAEPFHIHGLYDGSATENRIIALLEAVGMSPKYLKRYPHEFSGGQRQRIGIARALALNPSIVVLDEPVSALDVSIQAQTLNLLAQLQDEFDLTYVLIAHDLAVVRHAADRVAVMYLGKIVETADRKDLYARPVHPYTQALLSAVPIPNPGFRPSRNRIRLVGEPPSPRNPPQACRFNPRCWKAEEICTEVEPILTPSEVTAPAQMAACHFPALDSGADASTIRDGNPALEAQQ